MAELHIVCPHCAATNRLPAGKNASAGKCGACHAALFDGHPAPVDAGTFDKHRRNNDIAVLVDVWAPWCGPCRTMAPTFEAAGRRPSVPPRARRAGSWPGPAAAQAMQRTLLNGAMR